MMRALSLAFLYLALAGIALGDAAATNSNVSSFFQRLRVGRPSFLRPFDVGSTSATIDTTTTAATASHNSSVSVFRPLRLRIAAHARSCQPWDVPDPADRCAYVRSDTGPCAQLDGVLPLLEIHFCVLSKM